MTSSDRPLHHSTDRATLGRVYHEAGKFRIHILGIFLVSLLATPLALLVPVPLAITVDSVLGDKPLPGFLQAVVPAGLESSTTGLLVFTACLVVAVALLSDLQFFAQYLLETYTSEKLNLDFRSRMLAHAQRLSFAFHDTRGTADSIYRIQSDASAIQYLAVYGVIPLISSGFTLLSMIYIVYRLDAQLALVALAISPVLFFANHAYKTRMGTRYRRAKELESDAYGVVHEVLTAFRVVKAFGTEELEQDRFEERSRESLRARIRLSAAEGAFSIFLNLTTAIGTGLVLYMGVRAVEAGSLSLGDLLLIIAYLGRLYGPLRSISKQLATLQDQLASAERAFELLDEVPDVEERPHARRLARTRGEVEFRNVSFAYEATSVVLDDVSFSVHAGTRVGISGKTGAGKTTLASLLTRFYDPTHGAVLIDGVDIRDIKLADLRNQFAIVLQESVLFSTTIAKNIAYARPEAGLEDIVAAATAADIHEFIDELPDRYDTVVGERGMRLSGGERQRISLARAFLKDAPILILDEPTSSVDTATEASIMAAMDRLMTGRTTFMIAHRLSTLEHCDQRLHLDNGHVRAVTQPTATEDKGGRAELDHGTAHGVSR